MRLLTALLFGSTAYASIPVRYVLADQVLLADSAPDLRFDTHLVAGSSFRMRFESAFPGTVLDLTPERMISPDERVIVILARVTAVRTAHMVQAGSVHTFDAIVVGDVSALDPWTGASLFSATRMISGRVQLGQSALADADGKLRQAFREAYDRWIDTSLQEMRQKFAPFVLDAETVAAADQNRKAPGGIWQYGSARGLRTGATLIGDGGRIARVTHVTPFFSVVEDVANPKRPIPSGERYTLTVADKPAERSEPRLALSWIGQPLTLPEEPHIRTLDTDAQVGLFSDYLTKNGGLKLLPPDLSAGAAGLEVQKLTERIARYSKLVSNGVMTLHAETLAQAAKETPELRAEVGVVERYHGQRGGANRSIEHYYRITVAAALYSRCGAEESAQYPMQRMIQHSEELAEITRDGVREIDPADAWFTVTRNAIIHLSEQIVKELAAPGPGKESRSRQGTVQADRSVAWDGGAPPASAPLEWLRPAGEVRATSGESLGKFERPVTPSQGFLNLQILLHERLEPGDIVRYEAGSLPPLVGLTIEAQTPAPSWMIESDWQLRQTADVLARALNVRIVPCEPLTTGVVERLLVVNVTALKSEAAPDGAIFSGQWRLRLVDSSSRAAVFQTGVQTEARVGKESNAVALNPPDVSGWTLKYVADSLAKLSAMARTKGVGRAIDAPSAQATHY